jgi:release factor glutamine methyltransferase
VSRFVTDISVGSVAPTVREAVARGTDLLRHAGSPTPRLDAELLVGHALGRDRAWLMAHPEAILGTDATAAFAGWLERRTSGEPIAYIRGFKEWHSLRIKSDPRALIPRPETELLADAAIAEISAQLTRDDQPVVAWEVATGSGAVTVALATRFRSALLLRRLRLIATDRSTEALELAAENLSAHGVDRLVTLERSDLLAVSGEALPRPDVVAANLPYLTSAEVAAGAGSIAFEPGIALDGGPDGLDLLRRLLAELPERVAPGSVSLLEIGAGQADAVRSLAPAGASVSTLADLAGIEGIVRVELPA